MSCETFERLSEVLRDDLLQAALIEMTRAPGPDIRRLPLEPARDLVDQDLRIRQRHALPLSHRRREQSAHRHRDADADRLHVRLDELNRVVDGETGGDRAARER